MNNNYETYIKYLTKLLGEDIVSNLVAVLGEENIKNASYATTSDTGLAFAGSYVDTVLSLAEYASKINELLPLDKKTENAKIYKICLLSQIAKVQMFIPNNDDWQIKKQGKIYTFASLPGALRVGERSLLICNNAGIKFTEEEFEAMRIIDKVKEEDNYSKYYSSALTVVIKQALEIINLINKNGYVTQTQG